MDDYARPGKPLTLYFLDSSALVKLFVWEQGSNNMRALFHTTEDKQRHTSSLAIVEVRSGIRRRQRAGDTPHSEAEKAIAALVAESQQLIEHAITAEVLAKAVELVDRHNLRSPDSIQLATAWLAQKQLPTADSLTFISSDIKLLGAAKAEGFDAWNPGTT